MQNFRFLNILLLTILGMVTVTFNTYGQSNISDPGVVINGVKWATRNVDKPGTFADKPEDFGRFYQWNYSRSYPATGEISENDWNKSWTTNLVWEKSNDPSPAGWRVPTLDEIKQLLDTNKVSNKWTTQNGINAKKFTDRTTGNSLFLPAAGYRHNNNGTLSNIGRYGFYWSSTQSVSGYANYLTFHSDYASRRGSNRYYGSSIRAVAE